MGPRLEYVMNNRAKLVVVMASTCLAALLLIGALLGKNADNSDGPYRQLAVFTEVLSRIKSEYVEEPDMKSITLGAVTGLLESIDPFASYLSAEQYKEYLKKKDVEKGDVGLALSKRFGYVGVVDAVPGSPADKAGLTTGDVIEAIKGVATRDMPLAYAELLLKGEPGTTIELSVMRIRRPEPQKITLTRALPSPPPVVSKMLPEQVGYVEPQTLERGKAAEISRAVTGLLKQGATRLVLDLRHCGTGPAEEGVALADLFLEKGLITYSQGQKSPRKDFNALAPGTVWKLPVSVITNRGTAGGAEVAAAALLDSGRAQVVGEKTYGDASIRRPVTLDDGAAVILSVAKYYSPSGKSIQDSGVTPQHLVQEPEPQVDEEEDESEAARPEAPKPEPRKAPAEDPLLKKAVEVLAK